jgi:hypothetical protein
VSVHHVASLAPLAQTLHDIPCGIHDPPWGVNDIASKQHENALAPLCPIGFRASQVS